MNFKSILVVGLSIATLGLSLPAHAGDTATVVNSTQDIIVTGNGNNTSQSNTTRVNNRQSGRRSNGATGTSVNNSQAADIQGNVNDTNQINSTDVRNSSRRNSR
jgi:hypothetical protein